MWKLRSVPLAPQRIFVGSLQGLAMIWSSSRYGPCPGQTRVWEGQLHLDSIVLLGENVMGDFNM